MTSTRAPLRFRIDLPADPESVSAARGLVKLLRHWLDDEQIDRCELVVSEIVTNAIRYGTPNANDIVVLELDVTDGEVAACVSDTGPVFSTESGPRRPTDVGGFGLQIAQRLTSGFRVDRSPAGNEVRFTI